MTKGAIVLGQFIPSGSAKTGSDLANHAQKNGYYPILVIVGILVLVGLFVLLAKIRRDD